jgi:multicomponent Na+:H+ antiporter subunit B
MKTAFNVITVILLILIGYMLVMTVSEIPPYGTMDRPTNNYVMRHYLDKGVEETHGHNLVANIVVFYRGYDTLVEIAVLFTAVIGIFTTLKSMAAPSHTCYGRRIDEDDYDTGHRHHH